MGTHKTDVMGELFKHRLDANGKVVSTESALDKQAWRGAIMDRVKSELEAKQGCNMKGFFKVYRVPGNFHISTHSFGDIVMMLKGQGYDFDFSYTIHHLSFGNKEDFDYIAGNFHDLEMEHPADGIEGVPNKTAAGKPIGFKTMFYLVAVPSYF